MATGRFEVDTDRMRKSITSIREFLQAIKNARKELSSNMEASRKMWTGPSKDAFYLQFEGDCDSLEEAVKQIEDVVESMDFASKEYDSCDNTVRSIVEAMRV